MIPPGLRRPAGPTITVWDQLNWCLRVVVGFWSAFVILSGPFHMIHHWLIGPPHWLETHWPF